MNQIPNIEETHNTIDDVKMEILTKKVHEWLRSDGDSVFFDSLACANYFHHQLQKAREEERERIFGDIEQFKEEVVTMDYCDDFKDGIYATIEHILSMPVFESVLNHSNV